ncbi:MAG: hypothetical protein JXJ22_08690 [Bacteroidales bacterium]|nr:hypothetical protein [Bacteroidales bacterium]
MNRSIKITNLLLSVLVVLFLLNACKTDQSDTRVQVFYYGFEGFNFSPHSEELLQLMKEKFSTFDYIINKDEELIAINRNSAVTMETLDPLHPVIHRIEMAENTGKYRAGDLKMLVRYDETPGGGAIKFSFERYVYLESGTWELQFNYGDHTLLGDPANLSETRVDFLSRELARASFK